MRVSATPIETAPCHLRAVQNEACKHSRNVQYWPSLPPLLASTFQRVAHTRGCGMDRFVREFNRDRRLAPRHDHRTPVRVRVRRRDSKECVAESDNLSTSGVFVETDLALSEGAALDLFFEMPERVSGLPAAHWLCLGHVVRVVRGESPNTKLG